MSDHGKVPDNFHFEVDGQPERFDYFYDDEHFANMGALYGANENTLPSHVVRASLPTKALWYLSAYRINEDNSIYGIKALFAHGEWAETEDGELLYRVWDRVI